MYGFIILIFLLIFFIYIFQERENFANYNCPDSMIRLSDKILAYYSIKKSSQNMFGINPIIFNSLNEYNKYMDYQNERGMNCPILNINHKNAIYPIEDVVKNGAINIPTSNIKDLFIKKLSK